MKVMPIPGMARVPGGPPELRGVALVDGDMIPVVEVSELPHAFVRYSRGDSPESARDTSRNRGLSPMGEAMLVCKVLGECVVLVGLDVVATGHFERISGQSPDVKVGDETAQVFDVGAVIARVREGRWAV